MTLIAHGILALDKWIQEKKLEKYQQYADAHELHKKLLSEISKAGKTNPKDERKLSHQVKESYEERERVAQQLGISEFDYIKQKTRTNKAIERMDKLKSIEDKLISLPGDTQNSESNGWPFALAGAIALSPIRTALQIKQVYNNIQAKKAKVAEEKQRAEEHYQYKKKYVEDNAREIRKQRELDAASRIDETIAEQELSAFSDIIDKAEAVEVFDVDKKKDFSAMISGLVNPQGKIAKFIRQGKDYVAFFYNFSGNHEKVRDNSEASIFFINPNTGNFEQIGAVKSKYGVRVLADKINDKVARFEIMEQRNAILARQVPSTSRR